MLSSSIYRSSNLEKVIVEGEAQEFYEGKQIDQQKDYHVFPVSCLIHSGVWLSLEHSFACDGQGWDTSHVGLILVAKKEAKKKQVAQQVAKGLLDQWNKYLTSEVFCLVKQDHDKDKNLENYETVGGYYGLDFALSQLETEF